jgi:hypothetical protein
MTPAVTDLDCDGRLKPDHPARLKSVEGRRPSPRPLDDLLDKPRADADLHRPSIDQLTVHALADEQPRRAGREVLSMRVFARCGWRLKPPTLGLPSQPLVASYPSANAYRSMTRNRYKSQQHAAAEENTERVKIDPNEEYLSVVQLAERIPYKPKTIRNLMCQGVFIEGIHFTRLTGRPIFLWSRIQQLLKEGRHERAGTPRV